MKLILILGLIATAHCGTEHRRTARAKTTRSDMSHQIGDVDSDSARQRDLKTLLKSGEEKSRKSMYAASNAGGQSMDKKLDKIKAATHEDADARILIHGRQNFAILQKRPWPCQKKTWPCKKDDDCCSGLRCELYPVDLTWVLACVPPDWWFKRPLPLRWRSSTSDPLQPFTGIYDGHSQQKVNQMNSAFWDNTLF